MNRRDFLSAALFAPVAAVAVVKGTVRGGDAFDRQNAVTELLAKKIQGMQPGEVITWGADGASQQIREAYNKEMASKEDRSL